MGFAEGPCHSDQGERIQERIFPCSGHGSNHDTDRLPIEGRGTLFMLTLPCCFQRAKITFTHSTDAMNWTRSGRRYPPYPLPYLLPQLWEMGWGERSLLYVICPPFQVLVAITTLPGSWSHGRGWGDLGARITVGMLQPDRRAGKPWEAVRASWDSKPWSDLGFRIKDCVLYKNQAKLWT